MPRRKVHLPKPAQTFLATSDGRWCRDEVRLFHRWMSALNLVFTDLTATHLELFWEHQARKKLTASTMSKSRCGTHKYLFWLFENGHLRFTVEPPGLRHLRAPLPEIATRFLRLRGNKRHTSVVRNLHCWLQRKRIAFDELTPAHIEAFIRKPNGVEPKPSSRNNRLYRLEPYLLWLHDRGAVSFRIDRGVRKAFPIPACASNFVDSVRPVLRAATCNNYLDSMRAFHAWLDASKLGLESLDRAVAERWLKFLADRSLAPSTRVKHIFTVRRYLEWLVDRGELDVNPYDLLRVEDLPKLPSYLPRPFPVDADLALQRRLRESGAVYGQALFLMRRSGVRIGELVCLEPDCLVRDLRDNVFLKVPLGKLYNERMVPLDDEARDVLLALQRQCPRGSPFLILKEISRIDLRRRLSAALKEAAEGLDIPGAVVSHRLRHTYATELLNAGLPLVTIMKLLGHHSFHMTMRYAAIAQQTIIDDYRAAMTLIAAKYAKYEKVDPTRPNLGDAAPERLAQDLISALRNSCDSSPAAKNKVDAIIKRLYRLRDDILALS